MEFPEWAKGAVVSEPALSDLAAFEVLKESRTRKLGVGYTASDTFLVSRSLGGTEVHRIPRPPEILGENGARLRCGSCGRGFRVWLGPDGGSLYCVRCGSALSVLADPARG